MRFALIACFAVLGCAPVALADTVTFTSSTFTLSTYDRDPDDPSAVATASHTVSSALPSLVISDSVGDGAGDTASATFFVQSPRFGSLFHLVGNAALTGAIAFTLDDPDRSSINSGALYTFPNWPDPTFNFVVRSELDRVSGPGGPATIYVSDTSKPPYTNDIGATALITGGDYLFTFSVSNGDPRTTDGHIGLAIAPIPPAALGGLGLLGICGAWHWRRQRMA